jgi:hypothetical protein
LSGREVSKATVPLQPQTYPASVVVVKRKYSTLSRHNAYKKRWFECSFGLTKAVVKYIGVCRPNITVHRNAKHITAPYISTAMEEKVHNTGRYNKSETVP